MDFRELDFTYPEELVATAPSGVLRAVWSEPTQAPRELNRKELFDLFQPGDVLAINDTKVVKRRIFSCEDLEILFVQPLSELEWEVLLPLRRWKNRGMSPMCRVSNGTTPPSRGNFHGKREGETSLRGQPMQRGSGHENLGIIQLPQGRELMVTQGGLPQRGVLNHPIDEAYFQAFGEMALPPYIQKLRGQCHMLSEDERWYQTSWARTQGSCAAPTASLHFTKDDLEILQKRGVQVVSTTLHVGLGTFLPIHAGHLDHHKMHCEWTHIPRETVEACERCDKQNHKRIWALGSTVARSLESYGAGQLTPQPDGSLSGLTDLFIRPGFKFRYVDVLMTNFHQPRSTLLSMVYAFAGKKRVREVYQWAMNKKFRLFSYGDLSLWQK